MKPSNSLVNLQRDTDSNHQARPLTRPLLLTNPPRASHRKKVSLQEILSHKWKISKFGDGTEDLEISRNRHSKRFHQVLKGQKLLLKLQWSLNLSRSLNPFAALKNFQSISSLRLYWENLNSHNIQSCNSFLASLSSLKNLADLEIASFSWHRENIFLLLNILKLLKRIRTITSLSLGLEAGSDRFNPDLRVLSSSLMKLTQLRALSFSFIHTAQSNEKDLKSLTLLLYLLPWLAQISLTFFSLNSIHSSTLLNFFASLGNLKTFSSLSLRLPGFKIIDQKQNESFSEGLRSLNATLMRKLSLVSYTNFSDAKLIKFSHTLKTLTSLTILELNLTACNSFTNTGISEFCNALSSLVMLQSLSLSFHPKAKDGFILPNISFALKSLLNLQNLKLSCRSSQRTEDEDIQQLFTNLSALRSLKFLTLNFENELEITDYSITALCESLNGLVLLRNLNLNFDCAKLITNRGVEALMDSVQKLRNLSELRLIFRRHHPLDKKTANKVKQALKNLEYLFGCYVKYTEISEKK